MWWYLVINKITGRFILLSILLNTCNTASVKDIFNLDTNKLVRVPREDKLYLDRYGGNVASETVLNTRVVKPEDASDTRDQSGTNVGKRCVRCEIGRYPSSYDSYHSWRYDDRDKVYRDRYDDRYDDQRYDPYYRDRYHDRRYDPYERYDRYDKYDRYDQRRDYYDRDRDRYGQDRDRDRYGQDRDRTYDRGIGYDNRGYDYRDTRYTYRDRDRDRDTYHYRPSYNYDDRGDLSGRGYGGKQNDYASGYGGGYASAWNYGGGRDDYRDRYADDRYRYRDPYDGYRATSYLYGRPSTAPISNVTTNPNNHSGITESSGSSSSG